MPRPHISAHLRRQVIARAERSCEYCRLPSDWVAIAHHVDHVIALKHGGTTTIENLAFACFDCNIGKGSDIAAIDPLSYDMVRLFNPRIDRWSDHFVVDDNQIIGQTAIGRASVQLLGFNRTTRVTQRRMLIAARAYPL